MAYNEESLLSYIAELFESSENVEVRTYWQGKHVEIAFTQASAFDEDHCIGYISVNGKPVGSVCLTRPISAEPKEDGSDISISAHIPSSAESIFEEDPLDILSQYIAIFFPLPEDIKEPSE